MCKTHWSTLWHHSSHRVLSRVIWPTLNFCDPLHILGMARVHCMQCIRCSLCQITLISCYLSFCFKTGKLQKLGIIMIFLSLETTICLSQCWVYAWNLKLLLKLSAASFKSVCTVSVIRAMASASGREQFLKQFEQIVEGVKQNRTKVSIITLFQSIYKA